MIDYFKIQKEKYVFGLAWWWIRLIPELGDKNGKISKSSRTAWFIYQGSGQSVLNSESLSKRKINEE